MYPTLQMAKKSSNGMLLNAILRTNFGDGFLQKYGSRSEAQTPIAGSIQPLEPVSQNYFGPTKASEGRS